MMLANKNKQVSENDKKCSKCYLMKPRESFTDSNSSGVCNSCFAPYKEVIALEVNAPILVYSRFTKTEEEMLVAKRADLRGHHWYVGVKTLKQKDENTEGVSCFVKDVKPFYQGDENQLVECYTCRAPTKLSELEDNSKVGTYGFKLICDNCATNIDRQMDEQRQDK